MAVKMVFLCVIVAADPICHGSNVEKLIKL